MNTPGMVSFTDDYAANTRMLIAQTRRWAVTWRSIALGPWQGLFANSHVLQHSAGPFFDVITTAHDQWLDMWEAQANAVVDNAAIFTHQPRS